MKAPSSLAGGALVLALAGQVSAQQAAGSFKVVADTLASAMMLFLGPANKLYVLDKTERNPTLAPGKNHPAWASVIDLDTFESAPLDVRTNTFCAGGTVLGNGTWLNAGGNKAVKEGGQDAGPLGSAARVDGDNVYGNVDGGKAVRVLDCDNAGECTWYDNARNYMKFERWYPTLETLEDGSAMIMAGCIDGGYVNDRNQDNPTIEYFPKHTPQNANWFGVGQELIELQILDRTLPLNLYPLIWLLPSGNVFIQVGLEAEIFDYKKGIEMPIDNIHGGVRVYPASAGTVTFPQTPANNWTLTILFCGGTDKDGSVQTWTAQNPEPIVDWATSQSCVKISPDVDATWIDDDDLPAGRSMGQFVNLPDGRFLFLNGAGRGTAGYGNGSDWTIGQAYADDPQLTAYYYDPAAPAGARFQEAGSSNIPRMYHSTATLLPDGSVAVAGSNPNADYVDPANFPPDPHPNYKYGTEMRMEIFYPDYMDKARPEPKGLPEQLTYGGPYFNVSLSKADLGGKTVNINVTRAVVVRTGFSTHAMNMGQRHVELATSFTTTPAGDATLHVAQMPPNPAILAPGPALLFIVVDGVPSKGSYVMVGDGIIGNHKVLPASELPQSSISYDQWHMGV